MPHRQKVDEILNFLVLVVHINAVELHALLNLVNRRGAKVIEVIVLNLLE